MGQNKNEMRTCGTLVNRSMLIFNKYLSYVYYAPGPGLIALCTSSHLILPCDCQQHFTEVQTDAQKSGRLHGEKRWSLDLTPLPQPGSQLQGSIRSYCDPSHFPLKLSAHPWPFPYPQVLLLLPSLVWVEILCRGSDCGQLEPGPGAG